MNKIYIDSNVLCLLVKYKIFQTYYEWPIEYYWMTVSFESIYQSPALLLNYNSLPLVFSNVKIFMVFIMRP